jgi:hypothetical protein
VGLKRGRKELAEELKAIWRGWYVGGTQFKERLLALVEQPLRQGRSGSCSGEAKRAHGKAEAERGLARGLAALELAAVQLAETRKGAWQKEVLAWWLCQHTRTRRRWVSERLGMGNESRVAQAIGFQRCCLPPACSCPAHHRTPPLLAHGLAVRPLPTANSPVVKPRPPERCQD